MKNSNIILKVNKKGGGIYDYASDLCGGINKLGKVGVQAKLEHDFKIKYDKGTILHYQLGNSSRIISLDIFFHRGNSKIITLHDILPRNKILRLLYPPFQKRILQQADVIILHSFHAKRLFSRIYGPEMLSKIKIIPHFAKRNSLTKSIARKRLKISPKLFVFLFIGTLKQSKGIQEIIDVFMKLENNQAILLVAGRGSKHYINKVKSKILERGNIKYFGFVTEEKLNLLLAAADVVISFKQEDLGETSGILMRTIGSYKNFIFSSLGSTREIAGNYPFLVNPKNLDLLEKTMKAISGDPSILLQTRPQIINMYKKFSIPKISLLHQKVYKNFEDNK